MGWVTGIVVYVLVWWITLFAVLPLWVTPAEPGDPGHAAGAPQQPHLLLKMAVTTVGRSGDLARDLCSGEIALVQLPRALR